MTARSVATVLLVLMLGISAALLLVHWALSSNVVA